ncbi:unnamed protein product, partial [Mesorhabditis spiculigera]
MTLLQYAEELPVPLSEIKQGKTNFTFTYELDPCEQHLGAAEMYKQFRGVGFHFYHRTTIRSVLHNDSKEYYRDDEWSCEDAVTKLQQQGLIPDDVNFDADVWKQSDHAEYTCQTRTPLGCNECPMGFQHQQDRSKFRDGFGVCTGACPANCIYCRYPGDKCQRCARGFSPTYDNRQCLEPELECPSRLFQFTGRCQECKPGRLLVINRFKRACVLLCPKSTYLDDDTKRCIACPPWCKQCDGYAAEGPFYGETNKHCLACRTYARIETESKSAFCDISAIDSAVKPEKFVAGFYVVIRFPKYGVPMPGGTWINLTEARGWSGRAFSISFRKRREWDKYFEWRQRESNWSVVDVWKPFCRSPDCLDNCEPGHSIYHVKQH